MKHFEINSVIELVFEWFHGLSVRTQYLCVVLMTIGLGLIDYNTSYEFNFALFYLIPICTATWFISGRAGAAWAILCGIVWSSLDVANGHHYSSFLYPIWNATTRTAGYSIIVRLLFAVREAFEKQKTISRTDFLTGVNNARFMYEVINQELDLFKRSGRGFVLTYIDLDNFKKVNDTLGHAEGDRVLKTVTQMMVKALRSADSVGRLGGDEFVILMPATSLGDAQMGLRRMEQAMLTEMKKQNWPITFSMGVVTPQKNHHSVDELIRSADALMYKAKGRGKNAMLFNVS